MKYANLHLHTHYSLYDGAMSPGDVRDECLREGHAGAAITDHGTMGGVWRFFTVMKDAGLKPVIGCELYIGWRKKRKDGPNTTFHITLLAETEEGYRNLVRLHNLAHGAKRFYRKPRITPHDLQSHSAGIICLSGCLASYHAKHLLAGHERKATEWLRWLATILPGRLWLELQPHDLPEQTLLNSYLTRVSKTLSLPIVATSDSHHACGGATTYRALMASRSHRQDESDELLLPFGTLRQVATLPPEAVCASHDILEMCKTPNLKPTRTYFPVASSDLIKDMIAESRKIGASERLEYEIGVIERLGFMPYFAVLYDCRRWCRDKGIHWGYGRGSAAGSLFAYSIGITAVDPRPYGLLFERFLNPDRASLPDIDTDIEHNRRQEVIEYLQGAYGRTYGIATYQRSGFRTALKDVLKALGLSFHEQNEISKLVPLSVRGNPPTEEECVKALEDGGIGGEIIASSKALFGKPRSQGSHPAGVIILPEGSPDLPHGRIPADSTLPPALWEMEDIEQAGYVKYDMLGLRTLTVCADLRRKYGYVPMPSRWTNAHTRSLKEGRTGEVFQINRPDISRYVMDFGPRNISDLSDILALYRPGPLDAGISAEVLRLRGGKMYEGKVPLFIYQEDIMRYAVETAGYTMSEADLLRKAIGKKKADEMAKHAPRFDPEVFEAIKKFADYAFNKSHSIAYAHTSFETLYWIQKDPAEYYAAWMRAYQDKKKEKIRALLNAIYERDLKLVPPQSIDDWSTRSEKGIVYLGCELLKGCRKKPKKASKSHQKAIDAVNSPDLHLHLEYLGIPLTRPKLKDGWGLVCFKEQKTSKAGNTYYPVVLDTGESCAEQIVFNDLPIGDIVPIGRASYKNYIPF